jgi:hypothetical protein
MNPTFKARFLENATAFQCNETGARYIVAQAGADHCTYREGRMLRTGDRKTCVDAVESDAKWGMRK